MKPLITVVSLLVLASSGCISRTTVRDEPRRSVAFADVATAQTFYDAYLRMYHSEDGRLSVAVPLPYHHVKRGSENVQFNRAIDRADADHDRGISAEEARAFAALAEGMRRAPTQPAQGARAGQSARPAESAAANAAP
ncbi:MAG TPA: hypothetical protein VER17_11400 [Tepidisphaeraceae bacterium]|nr:hypothetical protein [Tepidisphaeraceae bacterium]